MQHNEQKTADKTTPASVPSIQTADAAKTPRSGIMMTLLFGGILRPAKAAKLTERTPLGVAFLIHAFYGVLIAATFLTYAAWAALPTYARFRLGAIIETAIVYLGFDSVVSPYGISVAESVPLKLGFVAIWIELAILAAAFLLCAWGAKEERLRTSWANAVRQSWLHTPYVFFAVVGVVLLRSCFWNTHQIYYWDRETPTEIMLLLLGDVYDRIHEGAFPFEVPAQIWRHHRDSEICVALDTLVLTWLFWALLARLGARAPSPKSELPPQCEGCGYNLTGLAAPGRCPECGLSFADPRSPDVRPGTLWQRERQQGPLRAWGRTAAALLSGPTAFGKRMQRRPDSRDHRRFFLVSLLCIAGAACFGTLFLYLKAVGDTNRFHYSYEYACEHWPLILSGGIVIAATLSIVSAALVTIVIASIVGVYFRIRRGQNMTAVAMQSACYASCVLPILYLVVFQVLALLIIRPRWFVDIVAAHQTIADNIGSFLAIGCATVMCIPLLYLSARVTRTMLHANR